MVICNAGIEGAIVSASVTVVDDAGEAESVTLNVSDVALPAAVGVPLMTPVAAFKARPAGSVPPARVHVYGVIPPVAASVAV